MKEHNLKTKKRAEKIAERWRRMLACHTEEIAKAEIDFDLLSIQRALYHEDVIYPELNVREHESLYNLLLRMKDTVFQKRAGKNKKMISFRLTERARFKLEHLASEGNVSMTTVIENLILEANRFKISIPEEK